MPRLSNISFKLRIKFEKLIVRLRKSALLWPLQLEWETKQQC